MPADVQVNNPKVLWEPSSDQVETAADTRLRAMANARHDLGLDSYSDLHRWSVESPTHFWSLIWDSCVGGGHKGSTVMVPGRIDEVRFFPEARLNVADEIMRAGAPDATAIVALREDGTVTRLSRAELRRQVEIAASALRSDGVTAGDRVVAWAPNRPEVIVFALAALSIGAVVSTASPDFAPAAVVERFGQIEPKVLLGVTEYEYGGRRFEVSERLAEIVEGLPTLQSVIVIDQAADSWVTWAAWCVEHLDSPASYPELPFQQPGFILFSSGTTGPPKCIVHSAAGLLLKIKTEQLFNIGLRTDDLLLYYTTTGWMMWNWSLFALATGAAITLYDGSPTHPGLDRLLGVVDDLGVTVLGLSAKLIDSWRVSGTRAVTGSSASSLRLMLSTGSPLSAESQEYVMRSCMPQASSFINMSGGTEICGTFISGIPSQPVLLGEMQGPSLGMATEIFDGTGSPAAPGVTGELVCTAAFPSMPLGFWGDDDRSAYQRAYFEGFPGVWTHGDFAQRTARGGFVILGRSDATLNAKGVRIGTAEIYRVVDGCPGVAESLAVAQDWQGDSRIILFVRMIEGLTLDDSLESEIRRRLRSDASPRHVPDVILEAPELPRTRSNKIVELTVADILNGRPVRNVHALQNPASLDWFANLADTLTSPRHPLKGSRQP